MTNLLIRAVVTAQGAAGLPEWVLAAVPCLFIYAPVLLCHLRGVDSYAYHLSIPAFRDGAAWWSALKLAGALLGVILIPWLVGYHLYQGLIFDLGPSASVFERFLVGVEVHELGAWEIPVPRALTLVAYQVFFVAIPEEFFYRGYVQTRLNEHFPREFELFGIRFGHGLWIASLLFAFGHSLVMVRWWHFATFFPGLLFGLLRERSGGVLAGAFFHAACNVMIVTLDTTYGVIPL